MRILGYILGSYMIFDGILTSALPQSWFPFHLRPVERVLPSDQAAAVHELTTLSPGTLRYAGVLETSLGLVVLALAGRRSSAAR